MSENGIVASVLAGHFTLAADSLGRHRFLVTPRVGETIVVHDDGEEHVLRVKSVTHIGDALDSQPGKLVPLPSAEIRILGSKVP